MFDKIRCTEFEDLALMFFDLETLASKRCKKALLESNWEDKW